MEPEGILSRQGRRVNRLGPTSAWTYVRSLAHLRERPSGGGAAPSLQLRAEPGGIAAGMTHETGVGAFSGAEARSHLGIGNVVDLVIARLEHEGIHDGGHVTGDAAAGLAQSGVPGMGFGMLGVAGVATHAHAVGIGGEFERFRIGGRIRRMRVVAVAAGGPAFAEARGPQERFDDEYGLAKAAIFVEASPRIIHVGAAYQVAVEGFARFGIVE